MMHSSIPWCFISFIISLFLQIECELCFLFTFVLFGYNLYCYYLIVKKKSAIKKHKKQRCQLIFPELKVDGIEIFSSSCNNKHIRQILQSKHKISPRAKLFWNAKISDITTWSNPYRFSILNNVKDVHNHVK